MQTGSFLESFYTVTDECAPYLAELNKNGCSAYQFCEPIAGVSKSYYVGGGSYGSMSEEEIIKELRARGPLLFDIKTNDAFDVYESGILREESVEKLETMASYMGASNFDDILSNEAWEVSDFS